MNEIKISVDVNVNLSETTQKFISSILGSTRTQALPGSNETKEPEKPAEEGKPASKTRTRKTKEEPKEEKPQEEPAKEEPKVEEKPQEEPAKEEPKVEEKPQEEPAKEEPKVEEKQLDLDSLRARFKTAAASQENRVKLREKLQELGCVNLTNLDPSKYIEMNNFIETL